MVVDDLHWWGWVMEVDDLHWCKSPAHGNKVVVVGIKTVPSPPV